MESFFWDERFRETGWAYGEGPNVFLATHWQALQGLQSVLDIGAGEGRNSLFLAKNGFSVTALDYSQVGLDKLEGAATQAGVAIQTVCTDIHAYQPDTLFDAILLFYFHLSPDARAKRLPQFQTWVKPNGLILAEWFHPNQRLQQLPSGGPRELEWLITKEDLTATFTDGSFLLLEDCPTVLHEGPYHEGAAHVTHMIWRKNPA